MSTLFLSDTHLGNRGCKASRLENFLKGVDKNQDLWLVGDIVDDYQFKVWPVNHINCLKHLLEFPRIFYLPGNHDYFFRNVFGTFFGKVSIIDEAIYIAKNGSKYFVTHGDKYDAWMKYTTFITSSWIAKLSRTLFEDMHTNITSNSMGFRKKLTKVALKNGCDGVICGHNHTPEISKINSVDYLNPGNWTDENDCTALVEEDGEFRLIYC